MATAYKSPCQTRALTTEHKFLDALNQLLLNKSFSQLTIDEIADQSGLTRSAFLKRFGTKKQALLVLYGRYCEKVQQAMAAADADMVRFANAFDACQHISAAAERLQVADFSVNRAMHELFMEELKAHSQTQALFKGCCDLMKRVQRVHMPRRGGSEVGAYAAAQLVFTINYNHVLKAMPGLPRDGATRHKLIATLMVEALSF